jgi:serine/threonine-protein phosphatase 2A regulatory subunit A
VQRLRAADWFTARVSVCGLFAVTYPRAAPDAREVLRTLFKELSRDETPMVRRAAALNIGPLAAAMEAPDVQQYLVPLLCALLNDDQESVRKLALESVSELAKALAAGAGTGDVLDACGSTVMRDNSWRVRHAVTSRLPDMAEAFGPELAQERLVKPFVAMLQARRCRCCCCC